MVFLEEGVGVEHVVLERLHVDAVQSNQAVGAENVDV